MTKLISEKYFRLYGRKWAIQSTEMLEVLGVVGGKLPVHGLPERQIQGIAVWVEPHTPHANGRKSSKHRVMCRCPHCSQVMSAGRIHQHKCKKS
jgi:hypothetical protein